MKDLFKKSKENKKTRNNDYYNLQNELDQLYYNSSNNGKFNKIYDLITSRNNILLAYSKIKTDKGSKTEKIDRITIENIKFIDEEDFIKYIQNKFENYNSKPVRRVTIEKSNGNYTPLGISTLFDRIIQQCILQILEPITEGKFSESSYGFRPNRSSEHAISSASTYMNTSKAHFCVNIDIKDYFDNINHSKLIKQMWAIGIRDKKIITIIKKMLQSPIVKKDGTLEIPTKGTIQCGILSPLLGNIVLNELDKWIESQWQSLESKEAKVYIKSTGRVDKGSRYKRFRIKTKLKEMYIVRYADDFKVFTTTPHSANNIYYAIKLWLKDRLQLDINTDKSKVTNLRKNYIEFLGFKLKVRTKGKPRSKKSNKKHKYVVVSHVSDNSKKRIIKQIRKLIIAIQKNKGSKNVYYIDKYNSTCLSLHSYYGIATHCNMDFKEIAYKTLRAFNNRLKPKRIGKNLPGYIEKKYSKSKQLRYVCNRAVIPIGYIQSRNSKNKNKKVNKYTLEGRILINKNLGVNINVLTYIANNPIKKRSIEYNYNRISLYCDQNGKCEITGKALKIGDFHCHHKIPYKVSKSDEYSNLILVEATIHRLIHTSNYNTMNEIIESENLESLELKKINKLRECQQLNDIYIKKVS